MIDFSYIGYNPKKYWQSRGKTYLNEKVDEKSQENQQEKIVEYLKNIEFDTVFEFGCGFGRMTKIILDNFDINDYTAIDVSIDQINNAKKQGMDKVKFYQSMIMDFSTERKFDLVFGTKVLMHIPEKQIIPSIQKLISFSKKHIINLDSYEPNLTHGLARHCFNHNYMEIYTDEGLDVKTFPVDKTRTIFHAQHLL